MLTRQVVNFFLNKNVVILNDHPILRIPKLNGVFTLLGYNNDSKYSVTSVDFKDLKTLIALHYRQTRIVILN